MNYSIYCDNCIWGTDNFFEDDSVDLMICDPPFGIKESSFDNLYKRDKSDIISGYVEAPFDYSDFTFNWLLRARRVLKANGSLYIISGWTKLGVILNALQSLNFHIINHIIWKFNFGVYTKKKFVTSHYHILYVVKDKNSTPTFNRFCRFGPSEKSSDNKALNYLDMEDTWSINKEYHHGKVKNKNKLPDELIRKIVLYSSNENDIVCDFFMGNFTTAIVACKLGRVPVGFELNTYAYEHGMAALNDIEFGEDLDTLKKVDVVLPRNQGKRITQEERSAIVDDFNIKIDEGLSKKEAKQFLMEKYERGKFSIINIVG
jgi:site-specific DNA-methyltransferase (adenine-specific)